MRPGIPFDPSVPLPMEAWDGQHISWERLANGTLVAVSDAHRFGTDALLLADFSRPAATARVCDLGCGGGIILLRWHDTGHRGPAVGVELSPSAAALLTESAGKLGHIQSVCGDLRRLRAGCCPDEWQAPLPAGRFDLVSCNPPYFTGGFVSGKPGRAAARHALTCTLPDVCTAAAYLLKETGKLCLCNRPERLADAILAAGAAGLVPKRLQFVRRTAGTAPWLFLLDCRKGARPGLSLLPDFVTHLPNGALSPAMQAVCPTEKEKP